MNKRSLAGACAVLALGGMLAGASAQDAPMTFFVTSNGPSDGANLGGLAGADAHCQSLAEAVGAGELTWQAYLGAEGVDPRDRIGQGPWHNANGVQIAENVEALHSDANAINKDNGLTETGEIVNGRGDDPNRHDILTGANADGTLAEGMTCGDWTLNGEGTAMVGHHDRIGLRDDAPSRSWNASHGSRGCGQEALRGTGGDGLFYCFAVN